MENLTKGIANCMENIFLIDGDPVPLARPRFTKSRVYNEQSNLLICYGWEMKTQKKFEGFLVKPQQLEVTFYMKLPQCNKKKAAELEGKPHDKRPDLSNLIKFVEDAALGVLYSDDNLIAEVVARKIWSKKPRTVMILREIEDGKEAS